MNWRPICALSMVAVLALLATGAGAPASADTEASASPAPLSTTDCSTAQLADVVATYLATPSPGEKTKPVPMPSGVRNYLANVLSLRLQQCSSALAGGSAGAACRPSSDENVRELWAQLNFCVTLVHPTLKVPSGLGWQIPSLSGPGGRPVIFVIGIGDPASIGRLVSTLVLYLDQGRSGAGYQFAGDAALIPEPSWSLDQYAAQCAASPLVEGAIVLDITAAGSGATDEFFHRRNWTAIDATALYAQCTHNPPSSQGAPAVVWVSDIAKEENQHVTLTPLTPVALLLMLAATYEVFAPTRQTATATTQTFPNPSPLPSAGRATQQVTTNTTAINASSLGGIAGGFLASSITYTNNAAPLTQQPVDRQTWDTLQSIAIDLMKDMNCWQPVPTPKGTPNAQDVVGAPRKLPPYVAPVGLGAYSSGKPSAPFCSEPTQSESINDLLPAPSPAPHG